MEYSQKKSHADLELNKAKREVDAHRQKINTINKAVEQAKESYRITQNLFDQGMETAPHLVTAEVTYAQKSLERLVILYHYYIAISKLELIAQ